MEFVSTYKKAENVKEKAMCIIAKLLHAKIVTPLGRIVLLPKDYDSLAIQTKNKNLNQIIYKERGDHYERL